MAYVAVSEVAVGDLLSAAAHNSLIGNTMMGHPVYATEAARNAAITVPSEGQMAYITAPTVPAAAGATTVLPSGIATIYNGAAWVCTTEVGAITSTGGSTVDTAFTVGLAGAPGTNPSITLSTGTTALITIACALTNSSSGASSLMSASVSGATTVAASSAFCVQLSTTAGYYIQASYAYLFTALTPGTNTFTLGYRVTAGTGTFLNRSIIGKGIV